MKRIILTTLGISLIVSSLSLSARQNNAGGTINIDALKKDGYACEVVSAGFVECTKNGSPTYWCTSGTCTQAPKVMRPPTSRLPSDVYKPPISFN